MKNLMLLMAGLAVGLATAANTRAQPYSIDWFKVAGGGGTSSGGGYSVSGTIGQADANQKPLTGATYSLVGGFWSLYALPAPGGPPLRIFLSDPNTAVIAWPAPSAGWALMQNTNVASGKWASVTNTVYVMGSENQVFIRYPAGACYYRLSR